MLTLANVVGRHRVIVCVGSGGVGKTTSAAAIALWGARQGRRTVVITIDPARRLATSLGLGDVGQDPQEIPRAVLAEQGIAAEGTIAAMMLDQKGAWDKLIERHAPSVEARDRILANPFYQSLSQTFAGSYEYMAIEELSRLYDDERYDLIVVDTPPTKHALDFLEAPRRLQDFLDRRVIRWFVRPYVSATWGGMRIMNRTLTFVLRRVEEATGVSVLMTISEFFGAMGGMFDGINARVERAYEILQGQETAFVLVTSPEEQIMGEADFLSAKMAELRMPLRGVIFNRAHTEFVVPAVRMERALGLAAAERAVVRGVVERALGDQGRDANAEAVGSLVDNFMRYQALARGEGLRMAGFGRQLGSRLPMVRVPNFSYDLHDMRTLASLHPYLFDESFAGSLGKPQGH